MVQNMVEVHFSYTSRSEEFKITIQHVVNTMDNEDRKYLIDKADEIYATALKKAEAISKDVQFLKDIVETINAMQIPETYMNRQERDALSDP